MEEPQDDAKSEIDISDSWTLVNNDDSDEGSINAGPGEPSDSESVEVLEDEQADQDDNFPQGFNERENEDCCNESTITDSNASCVSEAADIPLASVHKVKKYVHHPSTYINLWLSIVMVIAIAITLGLGIGHYLGSKRFARAREIINHLKYENQLLERELANTVVKHKYCEIDVRDRVRPLTEESNQFISSNRFNCRKSVLQDIIFGHSAHGNDENVCYADENPSTGRQFKRNNLNKTLPMILQWFAFVNAGDERNPLHSNHNVFIPNRSFLHSKLAKGDASLEENSFPKLHNSLDKFSQKSQVFVSKLNNQLTFLRSLFTKWGEFRENLESQVNERKHNHHVGVQMMQLQDTATQNPAHVSVTSDKNFGGNTNKISVVSSNGYCRLKVNQCILHEENWRSQEPKCRALPKAHLLCSILVGNKKYGRVSVNKSSKKNGNEMRKSETQKLVFKNKKIKRVKEQVSSGKYSSVVMDSNSQLPKEKEGPKHSQRQENIHHRTRSQNKNKTLKFKKEQEKNNSYMLKYSTSDRKRLIKKSRDENFFQKGENKKNYIHKAKNLIKNEKLKGKKEKVYQPKKFGDKQSHKKFQHESKKLPKTFKNNYKSYKNINQKRIIKTYKKEEIKDKKKEYYKRSKSLKSWNKPGSKSYEKLYNQRQNSKFCMNPMQFDRCHIHSANLKFGYFGNCDYRADKNLNKNKNLSENANLKYDAGKYPSDKTFQSYWKERSKTQMNVEAMKVYKS